MKTFREIIKKLSISAAIFLAGVIATYVGFLVLKKYESVNDFQQLVSSIWNYKLYASATTVLTLNKLVTILFLFVLAIFMAKFLSNKIVSRLLGKTHINKGAQAAIQNLTYYILVVVFAIVALNIAEVPLTIFTLFGGALAIGLGFGSQNILSNFISGIILQIEQPVKVGDIVEVEGVLGTVEHIGGRSIKILSSNNTHTVVPNSYFLDKKFVNWTLVDNVVRSKIEIVLGFQVDPNRVENIIKKSIDEIKSILLVPNPKIILANFGESGLEFHIYFWLSIDSTIDRSTIESDFRKQLLYNLNQENIEISFPQRVLHIKNNHEK